MKNLCRLIAVGLLMACSVKSFSSTPAERQKARPKGTTSLAFGYYEYLPSNYSTTTQLPIVIFFPGIGEKGNGTSELSRVLRNGPPQMVAAGKDFPFILISVQHPTGWWNGTEASSLVTFLKGKYKVDPYRVYVTGLSAGGFGTWTAGQTVASQLAAVVPICGCGQEQYAKNFVKLPVWAFHNTGDPTVSSTCSIDMVNAIKAAGGTPKLTLYNKTAHNAWTETYNDQNMWNWMLSQRRGTTTTSSPIVNAGSDKTVYLPTNTLTLVGTSSTSSGTISTRTWTKISGPSVTMADAYTSYLKLSKLLAGTYVFRFTVKNSLNLSTYDEVKVVVKSGSTARLSELEIAYNEKVSISPNPAQDHFNLNLNEELSNTLVDVKVISATDGRTVLAETTSSMTSKQINTNHLQPGLYLVKISSGNIQKTIRLIKQ